MTDRKKEDSGAKVRVLIVDDHPIVRKGLAELIDRQPDLQACAEADNAADALRLIEQFAPDVAIVDLALKGSNGLDLIKDIRAHHPKMSVLVLSMRDESLYAERALRAGARGYITKEEGTASVIEGIRRVHGGEIYVSEKMSAKMLQRIVPGRGGTEAPAEEHLTNRELEVLELIGRGVTTAEIAARLHLSVKTVETYRERIKEKLGLPSAGDLLKHAIRWAHSHPQR